MDADLVLEDLRPVDHEDVRALLLAGLVERWGVVDPSRNADLDDIGALHRSGRTLVVRDHGRLAGTGTIARRGREAEIRRMSVAAAHRRRGIGRLIVAELVATARRWGVERVVLETTSTWTDAVDLYRSCGFVVTHVDGDDTWFALEVLPMSDLQRFAAAGYVVVPGVVDEALLDAVDRELDELAAGDPPPTGTVGPHFWFLPPERLPAADTAVRDSPALGLAAQLVAPLPIDHALDHIQVALNIPPYPHRPGGPHVDGHRPGQERPASFTMLAAIYLGDESVVDSGNLWVWPGSHLAHEQLFRDRGTGALLDVSGHSTLLTDPPFHLSPPVPVLARRGDLLLAHFLLGHNIGGNTTSRTRRILYYRLAAAGHPERWAQTFTDAWSEYAPVRAARLPERRSR